MSWRMPGEGLNIGSRTRRLQVPLLRFSKPTIVREWPGGGEFGDGWGGGGGWGWRSEAVTWMLEVQGWE